jgi:hypothetical protein
VRLPCGQAGYGSWERGGLRGREEAHAHEREDIPRGPGRLREVLDGLDLTGSNGIEYTLETVSTASSTALGSLVGGEQETQARLRPPLWWCCACDGRNGKGLIGEGTLGAKCDS